MRVITAYPHHMRAFLHRDPFSDPQAMRIRLGRKERDRSAGRRARRHGAHIIIIVNAGRQTGIGQPMRRAIPVTGGAFPNVIE